MPRSTTTMVTSITSPLLSRRDIEAESATQDVALGSTPSGRYVLVGNLPRSTCRVEVADDPNRVTFRPDTLSTEVPSVRSATCATEATPLDHGRTEGGPNRCSCQQGSLSYGSDGHSLHEDRRSPPSMQITAEPSAVQASSSLPKFVISASGIDDGGTTPLLSVRVVKVDTGAHNEVSGWLRRTLSRVDKRVWLTLLLLSIVSGVLVIILTTHSFGPPPQHSPP